MLFQNGQPGVEEMKQHASVMISFDFGDVKHHVRRVEADYLIDLIGQTEYDNLQTAFDAWVADPEANPLPAEKSALLEQVRDVIAPLAFWKYLPFAQVKAGQQGLMIMDDGEMRPATDVQVKSFINSMQLDGFASMDRLLRWLETNKATYTDWAASPQFTQFKSTYIQTVVQFEKYVKIGESRRMFRAMYPLLEQTENFKIVPVISQALHNEIKAQILADTVTVENQALLNYIKPAVALHTIAAATEVMACKMDHKGITLMDAEASDKNATIKAAALKLAQTRTQHQHFATTYITQLRDYLEANASTYPLFEASDQYTPDDPAIYENNDEDKVAAFF